MILMLMRFNVILAVYMDIIIGFIMIEQELHVDEIKTKTGVDSRTLFQKKLF